MKPQPITNSPTFGIYKGSKKTPYGEYIWGEYKGLKIEIFDAYKEYDQKLQYVSELKTLKWVKSKLTYMQNSIIKIIRSEAK